MRKWLWLLTLLIVPALHGQVSNPGVIYVTTAPSGACGPYPPIQVVISTGVPYTCDNGTWASAGGGGSSGFPITIGGASIAASSTTTAIDSLASLQKVKYLSAGSDIGAQFNTAVTALSGVGVIVLPNSTNIPMSTTATNIPPGISIRGYGKLASIINCTVAGDCFQFLMNPTSVGEIGSEISSFEINGSGASNQVLMHFNGASGYTLHDLQFEPYAGSGNAALCLEFDNSANGLFVEGNRSYNVFLERQCTTNVLFNQGSDAQSSFGYNFFEFHVVSQGSGFAVVFNGSGVLYGGSLTIFGNHVSNNTGGGMLQFNGASTTGGFPSEELFISAEENGSGSGSILSATGSAALNFGPCTLINGGGGAPVLATLIGGSNAANVKCATPISTDNLGNRSIFGKTTFKDTVNDGLPVLFTTASAGINMQMSALSTDLWDDGLTGHVRYIYDATSNNVTFAMGDQSVGNLFAWFNKNDAVGWGPSTNPTSGTIMDTAFSRDSANVIDVGNGTPANKSGTLDAAHFITGSGETTVTVTPTVGQAACIKSAGPPVVIGTCSTVVGAGGACTCN